MNTTTAASLGFNESVVAVTCAATQVITDPLLLLPRNDRGRLPRKAESALKERVDAQYRSDMQEARVLLGKELYQARSATHLAAIRLSRGFSQQQVADAIGTSQPAIAKIEAGAVNIQRDTMKRLSRVLGITVMELDNALTATESASKIPATLEALKND